MTFAQRQAGFPKKAREICMQCDGVVSLVIFSVADKLYDFWTPKTALSRIIDKVHTNSRKTPCEAQVSFLIHFSNQTNKFRICKPLKCFQSNCVLINMLQKENKKQADRA